MLEFATLVKFFPAVLFAPQYKRWSWKMPLAFALTVIVAYLPYLSVGPVRVFGYLPGYARERDMISGEQTAVRDPKIQPGKCRGFERPCDGDPLLAESDGDRRGQK
jgi:hypothetical protein